MPDKPKDQFKRRILRRYFVRFHMTLILSATVTAGVLTSRFLLTHGVEGVMQRYPIDVLAAYLTFLLMVRIWIWYVRTERSVDAGVDDLDIDLSSPNLPLSGGGGRSSGGGNSLMPDLDIGGDGEGTLIIVLLAAVVFVILGAGAYLVWAAPEILTEAAFEAILASSLVQVTNRLERQGWVVNVVRATIIPFLAVFAITMALAYAIEKTCPPARTVREAIRCPAGARSHLIIP